MLRDRTPIDVPRLISAADPSSSTPKVIYPRIPGSNVGPATSTQQAADEQWKPQTFEERSAFLLWQNKIKNEMWLRSIPDYEKRLYDRVKRLNKRTVEVIRILIIGFLVVLIAVPLAIGLIMRRKARDIVIALRSGAVEPKMLPQAGRGEQPRAAAPNASWLQRLRQVETDIRLAVIARRQKRLEKVCFRLERDLGDEPSQPEVRELIEKLRWEIDNISNEIKQLKG